MPNPKQISWPRIFLIAACIYACLRFVFHLASLSFLVFDSDLPVYLRAAERLLDHQSLYRVEEVASLTNFQYAPAFALCYIPLLLLSINLTALLLSLLYPVAAVLLFWRWNTLFHRLRLEAERKVLWKMIPLALVYEAFWSDLAYLNFYTLMALLTTLLLEAILDENLPRAILWFSLIAPIKPFWAFPVLLPLIFKRWRFFFRLMAGGIITYLVIAMLTGVSVGWEYTFEQYVAYFNSLFHLSASFSWRTLAHGDLLGYNHSIKQVVVYLFGESALTVVVSAVLKYSFILPLVMPIYKEWKTPSADNQLHRQVNLFWGLYLGVFIWLDINWEVTLGLFLCAYLWPSLARRWERLMMGTVFGVLAVLDVWRLVSYVVGGDYVIGSRGEVLTDPATYIPLILMELLIFYVLWFKYRKSSFNQQSA